MQEISLPIKATWAVGAGEVVGISLVYQILNLIFESVWKFGAPVSLTFI